MAQAFRESFAREIRDLEDGPLGVALGKLCVSANVPVSFVASQLKLSRATVYSWFRGATMVPAKHEEQVLTLIRSLGSSRS